ncbi:MAG TPA: hypothetical protein VIV55_02110 [Flavobacterium sp.]
MDYLELKENQIKIYNGLKSIGNEIASFYVDGVRMLNDENFSTKAYLLAHIAREIDGGLRDLLSDGITLECDKCKRPLHGQIKNSKYDKIDSNHLKSILSSLDIEDTKDVFANFWKKTASKFSSHAHRSGAYKDPRSPDEVILLWSDYEIILFKLTGEYINQIKLLDRIIKKNPDEKIINLAKNFIREDSKQIHFYNNLKNENWFLPLYKANFFDSSKIPNASENKYWSPIAYLTLVSEKIKDGKLDEVRSIELISITKDIATSEHYNKYSDDIRIWYFFLKILSNLPKKYLKKDFLEYYKNFFNSKYDLSLASMGIVELLKSHLSETQLSEESIMIFEELLVFSFGVIKSDVPNENSEYNNPRVENYLLKEISEDKLICEQIASLISDEAILSIIDEFEKYLKEEHINGIFKNSIFFDEERGHRKNSIEVIYTDFMKNLLFFINQIDETRLKKIVSELLSKRYSHSFIIKLSYYFISLNWEFTKSEFFELIKNKDERLCFSDWDNQQDLYFLLEKISLRLQNNESKIIMEIIQNGSQNKYFLKDDIERFKELWLTPLRENNFFKGYYNKLKNVNKEGHKLYKPEKEIFVTWGSQSPYTKAELNAFTTIELASKLMNFDPQRGFRTPDADGLSGVLEEFVSESPEKFTANYNDFLNLQFLYTTKIIYGLIKAIDSKKEIDWESTLNFILKYISKVSFKENELKLENNYYGYNNHSFITTVCRLISKGNKSSDSTYDKSLIPLTEKIIKVLLTYIGNDPIDNGKIGSMMELINSANGVIIECYTLFLLRKARDLNTNGQIKSKKWKKSEELIFENFFNCEYREAYMFLGFWKPQLYFIDKEWTLEKIKTIPFQKPNLVKAFFGTHIEADDPTQLDYDLLKDVYRKAIVENWEFESSSLSNSISRHLGVFYLFGHEGLEKGSLLDVFFKMKQTDKIGKLIHFFSHYVKGYIDTLENETEIEIIKNRIIKLWERTYSILNEINSESSKVNNSGLINFLQYVDEINESNIELIINTSAMCGKYWEMGVLLDNLNRLKVNGESIKTGLHIINIVKSAIFHDTYFLSNYSDKFIAIFEYLYQLKNFEISNYINEICNQFAQKNIHTFNELYDKYNKVEF